MRKTWRQENLDGMDKKDTNYHFSPLKPFAELSSNISYSDGLVVMNFFSFSLGLIRILGVVFHICFWGHRHQTKNPVSIL